MRIIVIFTLHGFMFKNDLEIYNLYVLAKDLVLTNNTICD